MNFIKNVILGGIIFTCSISQSAYALEALSDRMVDYFNTREEAAFFQIFEQPDLFDQTTGLPNFDIFKSGNGDETGVSNFAGSFTKGFQHDAVTGLVTAQGAASFNQLVKAMESGLQADFNAIVRAGARQLVSPQAALMFSLEGRPTQLFHGYTPSKLTSAEGAAQMIEVYLQAICRHVRFEDYGTGLNTDADGVGGSITTQAAIILNNLGDAFKGPRDASGNVTPAVLFRGIGSGVLKGPYTSQFCLQNICPMSSFNLVFRKQMFPAAQQREFGVSWNDFVALQNGNVPRPYAFDRDFGPARLPISGADLATVFHNDGPCEAFYYAAQILFENNFPPAPDLPYFNGTMPNEAAFISSGPVEVFCIMAAASQEAIQAAWAQKWLAHRNRRPEAFAGLVHLAKTTGNNQFGLHTSLIDNNILLDLVQAYNQRQSDSTVVPDVRDRLSLADASTYLLSQEYAEASPLHPSYTSGHAAIAGACATVLKAYFKGDALIKDHMTPVKVDPSDPTLLTTVGVPDANTMTVNSELNKLASNACLGSRNFAGIHFREDSDDGHRLGEEVAIRFLMDQARKHREQTFTGFSLTKFDGNMIRITRDGVTSGAKP